MSSRGVNKVIILGNLGQDPEVRYSQGGTAFCNITIATSEEWRDKQSGEKKSKVEWHRIVFSGKLAEIAGEYLKKGSQVYVEGKLETRKWTDQSGQDKYTTEIVVDGFSGVMQMIGSAPQSQGQQQQQGHPQQPRQLQQQNGHAQAGGGMQRPQQPQGGYQRPSNHQQGGAPQYNTPPQDFDDDIPFK